ncbi:flavin-containing monooxygenase [Georgenia ruanii]|nr:NAD(P)/FAD-dependent oxidoreductase [Georgenia ruanii]
MRIAVIGAGISGIAAGVNLQKVGIEEFTIFEKNPDVGGTWFLNSYPGAACDVDSRLYSYSFHTRKQWGRRYAEQPEILDYLNEVVDRFGLRPKIRTSSDVRSCVYDPSSKQWRIACEDGFEQNFDGVIACVGMLNDPLIPNIPGLDAFTGVATHTARWPKDLDVHGLRAAVVGTGSSAAQIVPAIAPHVHSLHLFQRQPGWVLPKPDKVHAGTVKRPAGPLQKAERCWQYLRRELAHGKYEMGSRRNVRQLRHAVDFLERAVDDPALQEVLKPSYPFGCKRAVRDSNFYPALLRDNVTTVPSALVGVDGSRVIAADGTTVEVDLLVLATGFRAQEFLNTVEVEGPDGRLLSHQWAEAGGPEAFLGVAVPGLPNFFMTYGPNSNTATTSMVFVLERQVEHIVRALAYADRNRLTGLMVRPDAHRRFNQWLQSSISDTVWTAGCNNYFSTQDGKIVTNWPHTSIAYAGLLKAAHPGLPWIYEEFRM